MSTSCLYFVLEGENQRGPYTEGQLRSMWSSGSLKADGKVRPTEGAEWLPLLEMMERNQATGPTTATELNKPAEAGPAVAQPTAQQPEISPGLGCGIWISVVVLAVIALALTFCGEKHEPEPGRKMNVSVSLSRTAVRIDNEGSPDIAGREIKVFLNDMPPSTFGTTVTGPSVGNSVTISLNDFVYEGKRFDPYGQAAERVWIGGAGYDYSSFRTR